SRSEKTLVARSNARERTFLQSPGLLLRRAPNFFNCWVASAPSSISTNDEKITPARAILNSVQYPTPRMLPNARNASLFTELAVSFRACDLYDALVDEIVMAARMWAK